MLNKPKFMSPSINMQGNTVIDLNSETLPFSCIVDGNEAVVAWQVVVSKLDDNTTVFDSGKQTLSTLFYPINNRNQNVTFSINLREYFASATTCYVVSDATYIPERVYYTCADNVYTKYTYDASTWETDYTSLYYMPFVNSETPYYWSITLWGKTGNETHSAEEVFYANSAPVATIYYSYDNNFLDERGELNDELMLHDEKPNVLTSRKIFLKATYTQNENVLLKRYGWRLTDTSNGVVVIDTITQNQIYGVEDDISCECNGFVNDTNYLAELYIETQNGYFNILKSVSFDIDYVVKNIDADFEAVVLNNAAGIMLNWGNLRTTEGIVVGDAVSYTTNFPVASYDGYNNPNGSVSIEIPDNSSVVFEGTANGKNLEVDENSYVILSFQFDKTQSITLFEMSGVDEYSNTISRELRFTHWDRVLKYTVKKGDIIAEDSVVLSETTSERCWYVAKLYPLLANEGTTVLKLVESIVEGGLFPSDDLYPADDLYPSLGKWDKLREE